METYQSRSASKQRATKAAKRLALTVYDMIHLLGPRVTYQAWRQKFAPRSREAAAARRWERLKQGLRSSGCPLTTPYAIDRPHGTRAMDLLFSRAEALAWVDSIVPLEV